VACNEKIWVKEKMRRCRETQCTVHQATDVRVPTTLSGETAVLLLVEELYCAASYSTHLVGSYLVLVFVLVLLELMLALLADEHMQRLVRYEYTSL
jgi:hypothetical protein